MGGKGSKPAKGKKKGGNAQSYADAEKSALEEAPARPAPAPPTTTAAASARGAGEAGANNTAAKPAKSTSSSSSVKGNEKRPSSVHAGDDGRPQKELPKDRESASSGADTRRQSTRSTNEPEENVPEIEGFGHWELDRKTIELQRVVGHGEFGEVWGGKLHGTGEHEGYVAKVAVKSLKKSSRTNELLEEARLMIGLHHDNILRIYGVCSKDNPVYIITEFMELGSLLSLLRSARGAKLTLDRLVHFCTDVASGMAYLEGVRCLHRDLAARNVLVSEDNSCKIGDFGLAKFLEDDQEDMALPRDFQYPVRWTAPEVVTKFRFSTKCDVWGFGVVMYEIFVGGNVPYAESTNKEVLDGLRSGMRLPCPQSCPPSLHELMMACWAEDPADRPTFSGIEDHLRGVDIAELKAELEKKDSE